MIVKRGKRYVLKSKESGRTLGVHPSRMAAERQETAINMSKARAAGHKLPPPPDERGETMRKIRSGKAKFLVPFILFAALPARAASVSCASGTLTPTAMAATGPSANVLVARAAPAVVFQTIRTAGTATVQIEISCDGTNWAALQNSAVTVDGTTTSAAVSILSPTCTYRANVTACTTCSVTVLYACSGP